MCPVVSPIMCNHNICKQFNHLLELEALGIQSVIESNSKVTSLVMCVTWNMGPGCPDNAHPRHWLAALLIPSNIIFWPCFCIQRLLLPHIRQKIQKQKWCPVKYIIETCQYHIPEIYIRLEDWVSRAHKCSVLQELLHNLHFSSMMPLAQFSMFFVCHLMYTFGSECFSSIPNWLFPEKAPQCNTKLIFNDSLVSCIKFSICGT